MGNKIHLTKIKITIAKILYKMVRTIIRKNPVRAKRGGINYELDLTEGIDLSIFVFGGFQKHVYRNLNFNKQSRFTILDIGGNIGSMSLSFARMFPQAEIKAFEPTHFACERFKKNLALNPDLANRIELIQHFVADTEMDNPDMKAYASWKVGGKENGGVKHAIHLGTAKDTVGVGSITLDQFCSSRKIENIRLIKIDTDGHEHKVLQGAKETIAYHQPIVIFEIGQYVMVEHQVESFFYLDFFDSLHYGLFNSANLTKITRDNWHNVIPEYGTIDILARLNI